MSNQIKRELMQLKHEIDSQMKAVCADSVRYGDSPFLMRTSNGDYILIPLLQAKVQLLATLVHLEGVS